MASEVVASLLFWRGLLRSSSPTSPVHARVGVERGMGNIGMTPQEDRAKSTPHGVLIAGWSGGSRGGSLPILPLQKLYYSHDTRQTEPMQGFKLQS